MTAQFDNIFKGLASQPGKLRIAASGLGWKASEGEDNVTTVASSDIKWIQWIRVARNYQLRIGTPKTRITFDGFLKDDLERLQNLCTQYYNTNIESKDTSVRGWNWGVAEVQSQDLAFLVTGKPSFTIPLSSVINTSITKAEVALEFSSALPPPPDPATEDPVARKRRLKTLPDEVTEMRLYLPGTAKLMKKKVEKAKIKAEGGKVEEDDDDSGSEEEGSEDEGAAQAFHDAVKEKADIGQVAGESLCIIPDVLCLTPRGRFDIEMYSDFLRLRGKTYDYKIQYSQVQKLFLLQKPDDVHCQFVVNIDPPIRQGQTRYPYLVMQFIKDENLELELNIDEETLKETYEGNLKPKYDDPAHEVVPILFRVFTQQKVTTSGNFQSFDGQSAVKCNVKASEGQLYFLERQLLFISKLPIHVHHNQIASVTFARVGGALPSARTFDLNVKLKGDSDHPILFSALNKEELQSIEDFLRMKKIRVKNEMEELAAVEAAALGDDDDGDSADDSDAMDVDKPKAKGSASAVLGEEDDEDSEVDEDFQASSEDDSGASSGEDSDVAMSDAGSASGSEANKPAKKKQKKD